MGKMLQICELIIWDECTNAHREALEALDRLLTDLRNNENLFGGALILLSGDFRQTLPVIPRATPADEIGACSKASKLLRHVKMLYLKINMRVLRDNDTSASTFANQLLDIGCGKMQANGDTQTVTLPKNFCTLTASQEELIQNVFPNITENHRDHKWLSTRAVLAPTNNDVNTINSSILNEISGNEKTYTSIDIMLNQEEAVNHPIEFLNSLDIPGLPPHELTLKIGVPIILLRNINSLMLCNGIRLAVRALSNNVIEAVIMNGKEGKIVLLPRIPMIPTELPVEFKRLQFPVRLAFAMTINKAQGQTSGVCGSELMNPCFSRGQLYVACSRVGKPSNLFVHTPDGKAKNIVYPGVLCRMI
ncbi:ATP-dependent DNA helicase PIF6-like [Galendromus occidentalis]|uniref:ATP-dependent DNA helicase n=1 Tax=Galendromus occidentalis TaxID=34638 RepID=A0AAJ6QJZ4_9ACAR|nr:ATP-dependent DNA helicase PIF6-like [Galendromus occidentalis]